MGLALKFFCFIMVLGITGLFVLKKPDGTPWLVLSDFIPDVGSIKNSIGDTIPDSLDSSDEVRVYRWQDAEGNWQFSDKSATDLDVEQVVINTHLNRDLAPEREKNVSVSPKNKGKAILIKDKSISPTTLSPNKISKLINDAQNIQNIVDERKQFQDKTLGR